MTNHCPITPKSKDETTEQYVRRAMRWYYGRSTVRFNVDSTKVMLDTITPAKEMKAFIDGVVENLEEAKIKYTAVNPIGDGDIVGFRIHTR